MGAGCLHLHRGTACFRPKTRLLRPTGCEMLVRSRGLSCPGGRPVRDAPVAIACRRPVKAEWKEEAAARPGEKVSSLKWETRADRTKNVGEVFRWEVGKMEADRFRSKPGTRRSRTEQAANRPPNRTGPSAEHQTDRLASDRNKNGTILFEGNAFLWNRPLDGQTRSGFQRKFITLSRERRGCDLII